jgi:hypothetical protein
VEVAAGVEEELVELVEEFDEYPPQAAITRAASTNAVAVNERIKFRVRVAMSTPKRAFSSSPP